MFVMHLFDHTDVLLCTEKHYRFSAGLLMPNLHEKFPICVARSEQLMALMQYKFLPIPESA